MLPPVKEFGRLEAAALEGAAHHLAAAGRHLGADAGVAVYDQIGDATGKQELVTRLLEHVEATIQMDDLLAWAKQENPAQYDAHKPYTAERPQKRAGPL